MTHDLIIVGGGMAGLSCAWRLASSGLRPLLLEAASEAGGNVRSRTVDGGYLMERGPHTFLASADQIFTLAGELGLDDQLVQARPDAAARFIARNGRLHRAPDGASTFFSTRLLSWRAKLRLAAEPLFTGRGRADDSALRFFERRFGSEAARVIAGAFVSGVYAGDPAALSAPAAFPLFWGFEQESGSMIRGAIRHQRQKKADREIRGETAAPRRGLWSFRRGLGQLSGTLAGKLGPFFRPSSPVGELGFDDRGFRVTGDEGTLRSQQVVLAVPPPEAAKLLAGVDQELARLLAGIPMAPVAVASLGFNKRLAALPDGFGFLAPRGEGVSSLGVLFPSRIFDGRAPGDGDLLTGYVGGVHDPGALGLDDGALTGLVCADLARLTGRDNFEPDLVRVTRHRTAIPQLVIGHLERMAEARQRLELIPGLHLAGNYLRGVGIKDAVASGLETADEVIRQTRMNRRGEEAVA